MPLPAFETISVALDEGVAHVALNRPAKANAINAAMWRDMKAAAEWVDATPQARVAILSGEGKYFTAGLDLSSLADLKGDAEASGGHAREKLTADILALQDCITAFERCRKPFIAKVHGACVGGGVDIITACDLRYACEDAWFCVKEIDLGIVADVGTLQRLPLLIGEGFARELAYTGRRVSAREAAEMRLVNRCYATAEELDAAVKGIAREIASKSPLAIRGTKQTITYARDHSVADGLNQVATWNAAMLFSADLDEALAAAREKRPAKFRD